MPKPHPLLAQLEALRRRRGISRSQIATTTGYSVHSLQHWAQGRHTPSTEALEAYGTALGLRLTFIPDLTHAPKKGS